MGLHAGGPGERQILCPRDGEGGHLSQPAQILLLPARVLVRDSGHSDQAVPGRASPVSPGGTETDRHPDKVTEQLLELETPWPGLASTLCNTSAHAACIAFQGPNPGLRPEVLALLRWEPGPERSTICLRSSEPGFDPKRPRHTPRETTEAGAQAPGEMGRCLLELELEEQEEQVGSESAVAWRAGSLWATDMLPGGQRCGLQKERRDLELWVFLQVEVGHF